MITLRHDALVVTVPLPGWALVVIAAIRRAWVRLTYWQVACEGCKGTGLCHTRDGRLAGTPHSCCGDCNRREVPAASVPADFYGLLSDNGTATIGDGVMWRRPWSHIQLRHP